MSQYGADQDQFSPMHAEPRPQPTPARRSSRRGGGFIGASIAILTLIGFGGAILYGYSGGKVDWSDGVIPLLKADLNPTKLRPDNPGGVEVPHQDKLVFERFNERGGAKPAVERLLPPPEEPLPRPVVTPALSAPPELPAPPQVANLPPPAPGSTTTVPRPPAVDEMAAALAEASRIPDVTPGETVELAPQAPAVPAPPPTAARPALPPAAPVQTASLTPPKPAADTLAKPATAGGAGGWRIQLGSVRSEGEAASEWRRLSGRHADLLGGLSLSVSRADLAEKGIFYRVQAGGLDEARARNVCGQLKALNVGCVVVRP